MNDSSEMGLAPGARLGPYEILGVLGRGGMGEVYRARDSKLGRLVALKALRDEYSRDPDRLKRFEREAMSASALNHPNIVTIYDIGRTGGVPFIVMELVEGATLRDQLSSGTFSPAQVLLIALQIADGLAVAHAAGIVHRDLKPENVMLTRDTWRVKILDFGLAKLVDSFFLDSEGGTIGRTETSVGKILGTIGYMSPEQAAGKSVDHRSDQFALGTILYETLTGRRAFLRASPVQTLTAIIESDPEPLGSLAGDVPTRLVALVEKLLAKEPGARFDSTGEIVVALGDLRVSHPTKGRAPLFVALGGSRACPKCGQSCPAGAKFCGDCGERLSLLEAEAVPEPPVAAITSSSLPEGERRHATVLSSSLVGYAALVESVGPKEVDRLLGQLREMAHDVIESFGGIVNESRDEDLVALFGLPRSHEDDFLRAVRAARALHERVGGIRAASPLRLQIGVSTGTIVAQPGAIDGPRYKVAGSAVELANRLALQAEADDVLVSSETERLISPYFDVEEAEPLRVKGQKRSVSTFRVVSESHVRTRLEASARSGMTPYGGRDRELAVLDECLERAVAGDGQLVTVVGEVGVGKSRLLHEFARRLAGFEVSLVQGRCRSLETATPYLPWIDSLREVLELSSERELEQKALSSLRRIDPELEVYAPLYFHLLSIASDEHALPSHLQGDDLRLTILEALSAFFTAYSRGKPLVLLLEDWHWTDEASFAALRHLLGLVSAHSLLIVVAYRPDLSVDWGELGFHTRLPLGPLAPSSSFHLIRSALGCEVLPEGLESLIHEKTGGNPFFLEEVCHSLLESGTVRVSHERGELSGALEEIQIPDSVQGVIRSRLDRLAHEDLDLLRRASVIGREFGRELLQRTLSGGSNVGSALERLKESGLIQQTRLLPDPLFRFKHVLTQEVSYDSLLQHQRKQLHQTVGAAMEELHAVRLEEHFDLLAHHFSHAENWSKAVQYGRESAERALQLTQLPDALDMLGRTREWLEKLPQSQKNRETLFENLLKREQICETLGERARQQELIDELLHLVPASEPAFRAEVHRRQGELYTILGREDEAETVLNEALAASRKLRDPVQTRNVLRSMGFLAWNRGRHAEARKLNENALAMTRQLGDSEAIAGDLHNLAQVLRALGENREALEVLRESREISERQGHLIKLSIAVTATGSIYRDLGDLESATAWFERGVEISAKQRLPLHETFALQNLAGVYRDRGDLEKAMGLYRRALELSESANYAEGCATMLRNLGETLVRAGNREEAIGQLRLAAGAFAALKDVESQIQVLRTVAESFDGEHDFAEAYATWGEMREVSQRMGDESAELVSLEGLARAARKLSDDSVKALELYREAVALAAKLDRPLTEAELRNEIGILEWGRKRYTEALSEYERALAIFVELKDDVHTGLMLNSIGVTLKDLGRLEDARERLEDALGVHRRTGEKLLEGHALAALGAIAAEANDVDTAVSQYEDSLAIRRELSDERGEGWMCFELAKLSQRRGDRERFREYQMRASEIASRSNDATLLRACEDLEGA